MSGCAVLVSLLLAVPTSPVDDPLPNPIAPRNASKITIRRKEVLAQPEQHVILREQFRITIDLPGERRSLGLELKQTTQLATGLDDDDPPLAPEGFVLDIRNMGQDMAITSQTFDDWVFDRKSSTYGNGPRTNLRIQLKQEAEVARSNLQLDEVQYQKLLMAGSGDIQRFLNRVEQSRHQFEAVRQDYQAGLAFLHALEPLAAEARAGLFGPDSLFRKTLHTMTTAPPR